MAGTDYPFKNLVFEGGGVKGIAYVGALEVLDDKGILQNIRRVGGTSAGAINAVLLALNYSHADTKRILGELDFNNFLDSSICDCLDAVRVLRRFGWYKGDYFREWIDRRIEKKTGKRNTTFEELQGLRDKKGFKELYVVGTSLSTHLSEVFSFKRTPRIAVADAVRISMSIPLYFAAIRGPKKEVYVDGGVLDNYPVKLFDRRGYIEDADVEKNSLEPEYYRMANERLDATGDDDLGPYRYNRETLGFRLDSKYEIDLFKEHKSPTVKEIENFIDYAWELIGTILDAQANQHLHSDDWHRTIYIDTLGVKTTQFDLDKETRESLVASGRCYTKSYLSWYEDSAREVINRPS